MDNYEKLIERISRSASLSIEEIERKIEAKKAKLSGLISKEGAAQIVASELGINLEQEKLNISELIEGMKRVHVTGKIIQINPIREFNKSGRQGKVASLLIADETSNIRAVLWDTNHIALIEKKEISEGSIIEISNGNIRNGELHLSSFAEIKQSKEEINNPVVIRQIQNKTLLNAKPGETIKVRATIVGAFEPRYFEVNPETGKKFTDADKNNGLRSKKRALLNIILDDGTETIRSVIFGDEIQKLGLTDDQVFSLEEFNKKKSSILGEEFLFAGQLRQNQLYNTTEFTISQIEQINPDELLKELEAKT